jgi:hypothetical protein
VLAIGCGGGAGGHFDGTTFRAGRASFRAGPIPPTWRRIDLDGPMLTFKDDGTGGSVAVNVQCGKDADDVPLSALTKHLLIGFTEREFKEEKLVPLDGREALRTVVHAKLDGVKMGLDIFVMKKDGCVYDLVYVAPPATFAQGTAGFEAFVAGFGTVAGG